MKLSDFRFEDSLEELVTCGVTPLKELVKIMDEALDGPNMERLFFVRYDLEDRLDLLEETLYRFERERTEPHLYDTEKCVEEITKDGEIYGEAFMDPQPGCSQGSSCDPAR